MMPMPFFPGYLCYYEFFLWVLTQSIDEFKSIFLQARNNARILIAGSLSMFSNRYIIIVVAFWAKFSLIYMLFLLMNFGWFPDFLDRGCRRQGVQQSRRSFIFVISSLNIMLRVLSYTFTVLVLRLFGHEHKIMLWSS